MVLIEHNRHHLSGNIDSNTAIQMQQQQPPQQLAARLLVLGHKGVGKSASIVRYTTGRFIHQYSDSTCAWLYSQTLDNYQYNDRTKFNNNKFRSLGAAPLVNSSSSSNNNYNLIMPDKVELLEQKDIEFSSASNFLSQPERRHTNDDDCNTLKPMKLICLNKNSADHQQQQNQNNIQKETAAMAETNESLLFSSRVAKDQQIDNALHEKQKLLNKLHWANAYIVIYAINDVSTFNKAIKYLNLIANNINSPNDNENCKNSNYARLNPTNCSNNSMTNTDSNDNANNGRKKTSFLKSVSPYHHSNHLIGSSSATIIQSSSTDRNHSSILKPRRPILLLGNKLDLDGNTTRQVSINEGHRLALRHQTLFAEVSIAESAEQLVNIFLDLVQQVDPICYHLSDIKSLNPYDKTTICQWKPEIAHGPIYGNIVKSRPKYFISIAKSYRLCSSSESAQIATALSPKQAIMTKPLRTNAFGRSSAGDNSHHHSKPSGGSKIDFKASFKRASMAIVGSRALARQAAASKSAAAAAASNAANAKTGVNQNSTKNSNNKVDNPASTGKSKRNSIEDSAMHNSLASPTATTPGSSNCLPQQSIASSGRNSCDSTNSISLASGYASRSSDMAARLSTSSASSVATSTTTTSTNWFSWSNLKMAGDNHHHHNQHQSGKQHKSQQQLGHRCGDSVASGSPMSLSSPSSSDPKLSSSSMHLTTLSSSDNDNSLTVTPTSMSHSTKDLTKSQQQALQTSSPGPNSNNNGSGFGSRFKRPLFKYKSRRKTVAFEPPPVVTGALSETDNSKIITNRLDKQSDTITDTSLTSVHSTSTLDDIKKSTKNDKNSSDCNSGSSKKRNISLTSVTSIKSLNLNLKSSRKDSQPGDQQHASSPAIQQQQETHHTFREAPTMVVDSASGSHTNNRSTSSLSASTTATDTHQNQFVGPYYVLCEPEQVGSSANCPKHINKLSNNNNFDNNNITANSNSNRGSDVVYGTSNNNTLSSITVNKTTESAYPMYNFGQTDYRSNLSRASTSGGSYEIDDSLDDLSASSSCGASRGNTTKLMSFQLSSTSGSSIDPMTRSTCNNSNNNPLDSHMATYMTTTTDCNDHRTTKAAGPQPVIATVVRQTTRTQLAKSVQTTLNHIGRLSNAQVAKKSFCQALTKYLNSPNESVEVRAATASKVNDSVRSKGNNAGRDRPKPQKQQQPGQHRVLSH